MSMPLLTRRRVLLSGGVLLALPHGVRAQTKPVIRIVVGFPPGGATDAVARAIAV